MLEKIMILLCILSLSGRRDNSESVYWRRGTVCLRTRCVANHRDVHSDVLHSLGRTSQVHSANVDHVVNTCAIFVCL